MDNLPAHKGDAVCQAIEATGAALVFVLPYSPSFNPFENASANSRRSCKQQASEPSRAFGKRSGQSFRPSHPKNSRITSRPQDMSQNNVKML